jgi:hypothetical protein
MHPYNVSEIRPYFTNVGELIEAAEKNDFYLPSISSKCFNVRYLLDVLAGDNYCPKYRQVRKRCNRLPTSKKLGEIILELAGDQQLRLGWDLKSLPN